MASHGSYRELRYEFGNQILTLRTRAALTQSQLAEQVGVHRRSVQNWETGESYPKADTLQRLIAVLLRHAAFTAGEEHTEAQALWSQVEQDGPHPLPAFDDAWFARVLALSTAPPLAPANFAQLPLEHVAASPAPPAHTGLIDWGEALAVPYGVWQRFATKWAISTRVNEPER